MSYGFPPELQQIVRQELASGNYSSEDELLLEAVRLLHQHQEDLRDFKAQLQGRLDRLDRGEVIELKDETALRAFFDDVILYRPHVGGVQIAQVVHSARDIRAIARTQ